MKNNSGAYDKRDTTYFHLETTNGKQQTRRKHGHGHFCRLLFAVNAMLNLSVVAFQYQHAVSSKTVNDL